MAELVLCPDLGLLLSTLPTRAGSPHGAAVTPGRPLELAEGKPPRMYRELVTLNSRGAS